MSDPSTVAARLPVAAFPPHPGPPSVHADLPSAAPPATPGLPSANPAAPPATPGLPSANPGPLGLLGFGMTTVLLNLHNAGITELTMVIVAMGVALGGAAQIIAGVLEFRGGNTFGGTAFTAYGLFWWSLVLIWMGPTGTAAAADPVSMGWYLLLWGVFTAFMFVGTLRHNRATQIVFGLLALLFFALAVGDFTGAVMVTRAAGWIGLACGTSAIYAAVAQILNGEFGRRVLPMG
jgi:succinate-acetate transporter protein